MSSKRISHIEGFAFFCKNFLISCGLIQVSVQSIHIIFFSCATWLIVYLIVPSFSKLYDFIKSLASSGVTSPSLKTFHKSVLKSSHLISVDDGVSELFIPFGVIFYILKIKFKRIF
ncbi:MAG: hypothetical protein LBF15_05390 [Candidatus Peribacteria bacterium]|jgi:hypothetical protein|nr:hypothetical protein [Candidatus Peribacteria bacterium]